SARTRRNRDHSRLDARPAALRVRLRNARFSRAPAPAVDDARTGVGVTVAAPKATPMRRAHVLISTAVAATALAVGAEVAATDGYASANARLARAIPPYPNARLLVQEPVHGGVGRTPSR